MPLIWLRALLRADWLYCIKPLLHDLVVEVDVSPLGVQDGLLILPPDVKGSLLSLDKRVVTMGSKQGGFSIPSLVVPQDPLKI